MVQNCNKFLDIFELIIKLKLGSPIYMGPFKVAMGSKTLSRKLRLTTVGDPPR
jgi:hypothetical protein